MANISRITDCVWTGGDLSSLGDEAMLSDLAEIQSVGITHIIDNRIEWSDEAFVEAHAPKMSYFWNGQDDAGQVMPDHWFDDGVEFAVEGLADPDRQVLAHCHTGHPPCPWMAFVILLATGMETRRRVDSDPQGPPDSGHLLLRRRPGLVAPSQRHPRSGREAPARRGRCLAPGQPDRYGPGHPHDVQPRRQRPPPPPA